MHDLVRGLDGRLRCGWGAAPDDYAAYHDDEWGVAVHDELRLLEKLCLEGFQSGLSWLTVLRKRPAFREVFAGFDPQVVAAFEEADVERLLADARIIRHRGKIEATIGNARATVALHAAGETLDDLLWSFAPGAPNGPAEPPPTPRRLSEIPASTPTSAALSRELRRLGFRFVGPTTAYAALQALGVVDDHLAGCWRRETPGR